MTTKKQKTVRLDAFVENPDNPQTVSDADFAQLVESLRVTPETLEANKIAFVTDYVALDGTDLRGQRVVIAGNKRLRALKQLRGEDGEAPSEWFFDLTPLGPDARRRWLVKSNVQSGEWDAEKLLQLYSEDELADLMGADACAELLRSVSEASAEEKKGETDPDDVPEAPVETTSKRGEVYQLGEHRLMCGDSTDSLDFAKLTGGGAR